VINYGDPKKPYLTCYSKAAFAEVARQIMDLPRGSREREVLTSYVLTKSHETDIEPDGRLVLPAVVRDKIALPMPGEALFVGAGDTFQIWKADTYAATEDRKLEKYLEAEPEDFDPLIYLDNHRRRDTASSG
jgi:MraZ protein